MSPVRSRDRGTQQTSMINYKYNMEIRSMQISDLIAICF